MVANRIGRSLSYSLTGRTNVTPTAHTSIRLPIGRGKRICAVSIFCAMVSVGITSDTEMGQMMVRSLVCRACRMMVHSPVSSSFMRSLTRRLWSKEIKKRIIVAATIEAPLVIGRRGGPETISKRWLVVGQ